VNQSSPSKGSLATHTPFPSSFKAVNEGTPTHNVVKDARTPVYDTVKDANDQSRNEGIQRPLNSPSPESWAAAQREIATLRAANQKQLRRSVTPEQGNYRRRHWPRQDTKSNS